MTEFQKDLKHLENTIKSSKTITEIMMAKSLMNLFFHKYWIHISPMDPIFNKIRTDLENLYQKTFNKLTSANLTL